ncbi:hypothetical protein D3C81_1361880 [compost metagenome]
MLLDNGKQRVEATQPVAQGVAPVRVVQVGMADAIELGGQTAVEELRRRGALDKAQADLCRIRTLGRVGHVPAFSDDGTAAVDGMHQLASTGGVQGGQ